MPRLVALLIAAGVGALIAALLRYRAAPAPCPGAPSPRGTPVDLSSAATEDEIRAVAARPARPRPTRAARAGPPRTPRCSRWPTRWSAATADVLAANAPDLAAGRDGRLAERLLDRLR